MSESEIRTLLWLLLLVEEQRIQSSFVVAVLFIGVVKIIAWFMCVSAVVFVLSRFCAFCHSTALSQMCFEMNQNCQNLPSNIEGMDIARTTFAVVHISKDSAKL